MDIKKNLSKNLKAFRAARGLSMAEFSDELGISKSTLQSIMASGNTTIDTAVRISGSIGVPLSSRLFDDRLPRTYDAAQWLLCGASWYSQLPPDAQAEVSACVHRLLEVLKCGT